MKYILTITIMLMALTGCNSVSPSSSDSSEIKKEPARLQNHAEHDHTVDENTKKDYSHFETVKEEALKDAEFVDSLTEEELEFAKKIRPLHFDLKTMMLRITGTGILFLNGETEEEKLVQVREEADEKITFIEAELKRLKAPESMKHILAAYLESVNMYEESIHYFEQYFETEDKKFLENSSIVLTRRMLA
ncbi:hypothetical protein [Bacillus sp. J33]|uniref:hypothetical protein n=1 Tax=Bacillus sp. J33 TaxID=935836 RepID=UPI00047CF7CF|nr:hypothetical protein [Bacillus sp. J33]